MDREFLFDMVGGGAGLPTSRIAINVDIIGAVEEGKQNQGEQGGCITS